MSEVAEKTAEVVSENVEEAVDGVIDTVEVVRNNPIALAAAGVLGLVAGGVGGYFIAKKILTQQYDDVIASEIAQAKEFYANLNKVDDDGAVLTPQSVMEQRHGPEAAANALRVYQGQKSAKTAFDDEDEAQIKKIEEARLHSISVDAEARIKEVEETETRNVFLDPNFDLEEEIKHRTPNKPYIITHDEYFEAEKDYDTQSLTYFEKDDTLTNERDEPIREIDAMVGEDHLVRFGHGSNDKNIVYVRSDRLETDFEIIKSTGSYLEEVLGIDEAGELKHSNHLDERRAFRRGEG